MLTIYASIGNSDDRLAQADWSEYATEFVVTINRHATTVHGVWWSPPDSRWQNACCCFEVDPDHADGLRAQLAALRARFRQDSIAWAVVTETEFI